MKKIKKFLSSMLAILLTFSMMAGTNAVFANDWASGTTVNSISLYDSSNAAITSLQENQNKISFGFNFTTNGDTGNPIQSGDTVTLLTNLGTLFSCEWDTVPEMQLTDGTSTLGTVKLSADKIVITFTENANGQTQVSGTITTGQWLTSVSQSLAAGGSVNKDLTVGNKTQTITFTKPSSGGEGGSEGGSEGGEGGGGTPTPSKDTPGLDWAYFWHNAWTNNYQTNATFGMEVNEMGAYEVYSANNPTNHYAFEEQENMMVKSEVPEHGYIDINSLEIHASVAGVGKVTYGTLGGKWQIGETYPTHLGTMRYRIDGAAENPRMTMVHQTVSETLEQFEARIKGTGLTYGIYTASDKTQTFIANFGNIGGTSNNGIKYRDYVDDATLEANPFMKDSGPSNGNIPHYFILYTTYYPEIVGQKTLSNKAGVTLTSHTLDGVIENTTTPIINNGGGTGYSRVGEVSIQLVNEDTKAAIAGSDFAIQTFTNGNWENTSVSGKTDANGRLILGTLASGHYRLLQTSYASGYKDNSAVYGNNVDSSGAPIGNQLDVSSGEFTISDSDKFGFGTIVTNKQQFKVNFDVDGGEPTSYAQQTIDYGSKVTNPGTPTKTGYTFAGWVSDNAGTQTAWAFDTAVTSDLTLKAKWDVNDFTVNWVSEDTEHGTVSNNAAETVAFNGFATTDVVVTPKTDKDTWEFAGWSYRFLPVGLADEASNYVEGTTMDYKTVNITGDVTFTATFAQKHTVNVTAVNGKVAIAQGTTHPTSVSAVTDLTTFATATNDAREVAIKYENDVHHHLTKIEVSDKHGNSAVVYSTNASEVSTSVDMKDSTLVVLNSLTEGKLTITGIKNSLDVKLTFTADNTFSVKFYDEAMSDVTASTPTYAQNDGLYAGDDYGAAPVSPTLTGKTFVGWSTDGVNVNYSSTDKIANSDVNVYAIWADTSYTVKYDLNGGQYELADTVPAKTTLFTSSNLLPDNEPTKTGYTFDGWYLESTEVTDTTTYDSLVADDTVMSVTLTAKWVANTYTVTFDKNADDATGTMSDQSFTYDVSQPLSKNEFTRHGYTFAGWTTTPNAKAGTFNDQEAVENLIDTNNGNVTLYAIWGENSDTAYTVEHYIQQADGTYSLTPTEVEDLTGVTNAKAEAVVKTTTDTGFEHAIFDEENTLNVLTGTIAGDGSLVLKVYYNLTLTVTFDVAGGTPTIDDQEIVYGNTLEEPTVPTKEGYIFRGWTYNTAGDVWNFSDKVTESMTMVAKWEAIPVIAPTENKETPNTPTKTTTKVVKTGDEASIALFGMLSVASLCILVLLRKRERELHK